MAKDSSYTTKEEQLARIAKAMGHPARIAILNFLARFLLYDIYSNE